MRRARTGAASATRSSTGLRLISFLLVPASVAAAVLATPIVRLLYQHRNFTAHDTKIVAACLAAFALGLTFNGTMLMLNRGFFSLQSPWIPSWVAFGNLGLNAAARRRVLPVRDLGNPALDLAREHRRNGGAPRTSSGGGWAGSGSGRRPGASSSCAVASAVLAVVAWGVWHLLDSGLGQSLAAQIVSLGAGLVLGYAAFFGVCRLLGVRELDTLLRLRRGRA